MRTRQQQNKPSSSSADQDTSTVTTATNSTTTTTVASTTMIDPVTEHRTQMPPTVSSPSYENMLEPSSSSLSQMQVHSSRQQAFSFSNQTHSSLQVPTHAARLPPFSSFVQDQTHITAPAMPPRLPSSSYFSAFTPTSAIQQQQHHPPAIMAANGAIGDDARVLPAPGTVRLPPIPFYFHHPEFGMESTMLQLSSFGRADQSSG
ncbi:hypothetical protein K492DRAFT_178775 [Lichtheimia hyalospora FSU 10163]|nr:hypothetical protein K492DRAFT_178775 [Lichtheimia hyalospora FSU 10163]